MPIMNIPRILFDELRDRSVAIIETSDTDCSHKKAPSNISAKSTIRYTELLLQSGNFHFSVEYPSLTPNSDTAFTVMQDGKNVHLLLEGFQLEGREEHADLIELLGIVMNRVALLIESAEFKAFSPNPENN